LWLDKEQAERHDREIDVLTTHCVLNRLGEAAEEETLEAAYSLRVGKTLPGMTRQKEQVSRTRCQVSDLRKIAPTFS
jgi:hypothetical protein